MYVCVACTALQIRKGSYNQHVCVLYVRACMYVCMHACMYMRLAKYHYTGRVNNQLVCVLRMPCTAMQNKGCVCA